jgi:transposase
MDLGKSKTVVCFYDSDSGNHRFEKVKTSPQQIHDLIVGESAERVVFEICSVAGWVYDIVHTLGFEVQAANPNTQGWRWKNVKRKNDRQDALKLAQLSAMNQLPTVHVPSREVRQKRALIQYRQRLVKRATQIKNSIRAILDKEGYSMAKGKCGWTEQSLEQLRQLSRPVEECDGNNLWRGQLNVELAMLEATGKCLAKVTAKLDEQAKSDEQIRLLRTAAGVGPRLAEAIVAFIDKPERFATGKQVGCYAGLTPKQYQSGNMDRQGRISGHGNKLLRAVTMRGCVRLISVCYVGVLLVRR